MIIVLFVSRYPLLQLLQRVNGCLQPVLGGNGYSRSRTFLGGAILEGNPFAKLRMKRIAHTVARMGLLPSSRVLAIQGHIDPQQNHRLRIAAHNRVHRLDSHGKITLPSRLVNRQMTTDRMQVHIVRTCQLYFFGAYIPPRAPVDLGIGEQEHGHLPLPIDKKGRHTADLSYFCCHHRAVSFPVELFISCQAGRFQASIASRSP